MNPHLVQLRHPLRLYARRTGFLAAALLACFTSCNYPADCGLGHAWCQKWLATWVLFDPFDPCRRDMLSVIQPAFWPSLHFALNQQVARGSSGSPAITTFGSTGASQYQGAALAPNGKLYAVPSGAGNVLEIEPIAQTITTFGSTGASNYSGATVAPNGKIYGVPSGGAGNVLEVDPVAANGQHLRSDRRQ